MGGSIVGTVAGLAAAVALAVGAGAARADADEARTPQVEGAHPALEGAAMPEPAEAGSRTPSTPLSRAAVRARIQGIDPGGWLARFGDVERHTDEGR